MSVIYKFLNTIGYGQPFIHLLTYLPLKLVKSLGLQPIVVSSSYR